MSNMSRAVDRVKVRMRSGARLMMMHTVNGRRWFVVPGREVSPEVAAELIKEPDIYESDDGLFPGIPQTYGIKNYGE